MIYAMELTTKQNHVNFAWIELTNRCNLQCVHCYASSGPDEGGDDTMTLADYKAVLDDLSAMGCENIQFIGGEATIYKDFTELLDHALALDFQTVEIYTNLLYLPKALKDRIRTHKIPVASSFYSYVPAVHDAITQGKNSWERTVRNLRYLAEEQVDLRVGFVEMEQNTGHYEKTLAFLQSIGISELSYDKARSFGRQEEQKAPDMTDLCGECAGDVICVSPAGLVSPCIMSKSWGIGNLAEASLSTLVGSQKLSETRALIRETTTTATACHPKLQDNTCNPQSPLGMGQPVDGCHPKIQESNCHPHSPAKEGQSTGTCHPLLQGNAGGLCHPHSPEKFSLDTGSCHPLLQSNEGGICHPKSPEKISLSEGGCHPLLQKSKRSTCHPHSPEKVSLSTGACHPKF